MIENLDAKLMMALTATRQTGAGAEGNWSDYVKALGGKLYRPDVAPGEVEVGEDAPKTAAPKPQAPGAAGKLAITNPLFETNSSQKR
jgi:hypothetical protein